jgi:hypothetical protein
MFQFWLCIPKLAHEFSWSPVIYDEKNITQAVPSPRVDGNIWSTLGIRLHFLKLPSCFIKQPFHFITPSAMSEYFSCYTSLHV